MELLNQTETKKLITLIKTNGKKMDERIHQAGCSALSHFQEHGDASFLTELVDAMPKSSRGNALKYWITEHASVKWSKTAYKGTGGYIQNGKERVVKLEEAIESPFYEKKDTEAHVFNPETRIKAFLNSFKSAYAKGQITADDIDKMKHAVTEAVITA